MMKLAGVFVTLLAAVTVSATSSQAHLNDDSSLDVPGENPLHYCEDPEDYILKIDSVDLDPNPPQAGKDLTITAKGTLSQEVKKGTLAHITVKYGLIKILEQDFNICDQASDVDLKCPLKGDVELKKTVALPKQIPPGTYNVLANVTTKDDDLVTCLQAAVPFHLGGGLGAMLGSDDL